MTRLSRSSVCVIAFCASAKKKLEEEEETAPISALAAVMATKDTAPKAATVKATPPAAVLAPTVSTGAEGLGGEIVAKAPVTTFDRAKSYLLHLAVNGVQMVHISGATPEEAEKNKGLQAMGRLGGCSKLVFFDVKEGEIRGVRVEGAVYVRAEEVVID